MASHPTSLSLSLDSTFQPLLFRSCHQPSSSSSLTFPSASHSLLSFHGSHPFTLKSFLSLRSLPATKTVDPSVQDPQKLGSFQDPLSRERQEILDGYSYSKDLGHGHLEIRPMVAGEEEATARLLAESFVETLWMSDRYVDMLAFLVKLYVLERISLKPHMVVLVGLYREKGKEEAKLACTAEVSFDAIGANAAPPTPLPPRVCPYICNMTVGKEFRRKKIGSNLLAACEELIAKMKTKEKVYLHCRMVDKIPFEMYKNAGYKVVKKDSFLILLTLQRRKYLMCKELDLQPASNDRHDEAI